MYMNYLATALIINAYSYISRGGGGGGDTITNGHVIGSGPFHVAPDGPIERGAQEQSGRWNRLSHADI